MRFREFERYLLLLGPLEAHANAVLCWLSENNPGGTVVAAAHSLPQNSETVRDPIGEEDHRLEFRRQGERDLAFSSSFLPKTGIPLSDTFRPGEQVEIHGYHQRRRYHIQGTAVSTDEQGRLLVRLRDIRLLKPGMSGSVLVNRRGEALGVLVRERSGLAVIEPLFSLR